MELERPSFGPLVGHGEAFEDVDSDDVLPFYDI